MQRHDREPTWAEALTFWLIIITLMTVLMLWARGTGMW